MEEGDRQLLAGKKMRSLGNRAHDCEPAGRGNRIHLSLAVPQPVDEAFQLPGNAQMIHRDGIEDDIRSYPSVPKVLEIILDDALPLCLGAAFTACAGSHLR